MKKQLLRVLFLFACLHSLAIDARVASAASPHIILLMADDMGWGQTGYRNHPILKTPNLDAMAMSPVILASGI